MSFGRKGLAAGEAVAAPAFGKAQGFGGAAAQANDDIAAKREAFIASERARKNQPPAPTSFDPAGSSAPRSTKFDHLAGGSRAASPLAARMEGADPAAYNPRPRKKFTGFDAAFGVPEKRNVAIAYLFWFLLGQISAHRFYCGDRKGAVAQMTTFFISIFAMFFAPFVGMVGMGIWVFWIIADLFLIPGLLKKYQEAHRSDYSSVFA
ncbi:TM2 domain-containing protein [Erythrobacter crassostreae]|uniref:TM2 domain-containing protein n=1 Tax=Erythrobacter crassostreae TaxID=2828328 RepID=A0A9X1F3Q4_9SPHN|nr:TM2 domain-containing protein [Erythrobacter crassostrea]MBV7259589.1 TM2 domain-containing protein [Erythrobacter crassostrea]